MDFKVYDGAIIPRWAHKLRLGRITQYLRRELGGPDGVAYEIARRATISKSAIEKLLAAKIALESEELQREFDPLYNERVRGLGERHIAVLGGLTRICFL